MTDTATIEASTAEPAERKEIKGIVRVPLNPEKHGAGRTLTMTEPTEGLTSIPLVDDGNRQYQFAAFIFADRSCAGVDFYRETSAVRLVGTLYHLKSIHIVSIPSEEDLHDYFYKRIYPAANSHPWAKEAWFFNNLERWAEHLPVPSETVPGNIAYFQSPAKRARDIQTPIKPGRYLKKYFGDILSEAEIHEKALAWQNHFAMREVKITQDADEIERVYKGRYNGSCMHFGNGGFDGHCHPARAYAGPDLGIAYIGDTDNADARCLVWPDKKIFYPKWYGDSSRLEAALIGKGFKSAYAENFMGARMQRIEDHPTSGFVVPYVDVCEYALDNGTHLVLTPSNGGVYLRQTSGTSGEGLYCADCGGHVLEDDLYSIEETGEQVCLCCFESSYFTCEETGYHYPNNSLAATPDRYYVSVQGLSYPYGRTWFYCDHTKLNYPESDYTPVTLIDGSTCESGHAEENGFLCAFTEMWSLDLGEKVTLSDGTTVHADALATSWFDDWLVEKGISTGTIPAPNQLDMLEAA